MFHSGSVLIGGRDLTRLSESERARFRRENVGFSFQANNLVPYLTVRENVELACRLRGALTRADRDRAADLLDRLGLASRLNSLPSQLRGGQQQRVAIARALVHNPLVVLADEPTAALDTDRGRQVVQAFSELTKAQGRAGLMVTHDLRMVQYTDAVVRMVDGRVEDIVRDRHAVEMLAGMHQRVAGLSKSLSEHEHARRGALELAG